VAFKWRSVPKGPRGLIFADREDGIRVYGVRTSEVDATGKRRDIKRAVGISKDAALADLHRQRLADERAKMGERLGMTPPPDEGLTLGELWDRFRDEMVSLEGIGPNYAQYAAEWLEALGEERRILSIQPGDIRSWMRAEAKTLTRYGTPYKPASINRRLAMLRRLFNLAQRDQVTRHQPVPRNTLLRENNKRRRFLQEGELDRLRERCAPEFWMMIEVALLTGLRRAELCRLEWRDLDLGRGLFRVRASKRHEDEWLPLHPRATEILALAQSAHRQRGQRVFPGWTPNTVTKRFQGLCRQALLVGQARRVGGPSSRLFFERSFSLQDNHAAWRSGVEVEPSACLGVGQETDRRGVGRPRGMAWLSSLFASMRPRRWSL
jgi:integrase